MKVALALALILALFGSTETEVERYSIGMEVVHVEKADSIFYLCGDDKMITAKADTRFAQGDWVEVEIQVLENSLTHATEEHVKIIGEME